MGLRTICLQDDLLGFNGNSLFHRCNPGCWSENTAIYIFRGTPAKYSWWAYPQPHELWNRFILLNANFNEHALSDYINHTLISTDEITLCFTDPNPVPSRRSFHDELIVDKNAHLF